MLNEQIKKKIIAIICCAVFILGLVGCTNEENETISSTTRSKNVYVYEDKETGVNYMMFIGLYEGDICPRYNADGSLYVGGAE